MLAQTAMTFDKSYGGGRSSFAVGISHETVPLYRFPQRPGQLAGAVALAIAVGIGILSIGLIAAVWNPSCAICSQPCTVEDMGRQAMHSGECGTHEIDRSDHRSQ